MFEFSYIVVPYKCMTIYSRTICYCRETQMYMSKYSEHRIKKKMKHTFILFSIPLQLNKECAECFFFFFRRMTTLRIV